MNKLNRERLQTWVYLVLCFGVVLFLGLWVAFQPSPEGPDLQDYFEQKKRSEARVHLSKLAGDSADEMGRWQMAEAFLVDASLAIENLKTSYYEEDKLVWELNSDSLENSKIPGAYLLKMVHLRDSQGKNGDVVITSNRALLNWKNKNLELFDDVKVENSNGSKMHTERMRYDEEKRIIESQSPFVFFLPDKTVLTGVGFVTSPGFKNMKFYELTSKTGINPNINF